MAERVTGERLLDAETLSYVDSVTQMSNWVSGEPVDGFLVAAPLSQLGVEALLEDRFDVARPLKIWLSTRGRECAGLYIGIIAGQSDLSRRQLLMMISMLRSDVFADVYCFARGVTEEGCRAMRSMGMTPFPTDASRLFVQMPRPAKGEVAA